MIENNYFYKQFSVSIFMVSCDFELKRNVCDSLLLNFDKPLKIMGDREFTIPSQDKCENIFRNTLSEIYGKNLDSEHVGYCALKLKETQKISSRILDGFYDSFSGDRDFMNFFEMHLSSFFGSFDSEFFYGYGTMYRYYPKDKEEALKNVNSFFDKSELESLSSFGVLIRKHRDIVWGRHEEILKKRWS